MEAGEPVASSTAAEASQSNARSSTPVMPANVTALVGTMAVPPATKAASYLASVYRSHAASQMVE